VWYSFAIVRVVPRVEREEFVNAGVILFSAEAEFLGAIVELPLDRLAAIAPSLDPAEIQRRLDSIQRMCDGNPDAGPLATMAPAERFHWLTAPRSTVIQTSPVHVGCSNDPAGELARMLEDFVRLPAAGRGD